MILLKLAQTDLKEAIEVIKWYSEDRGWHDDFSRTGFKAKEFLKKVNYE
jgi:hypothetical protein